VKFSRGFIARKTGAGITVALRTGTKGEYEFISSAEVIAFHTKGGKTLAILPDRTVQTQLSITELKPQLKKIGRWLPIGRGIYLNFHRLVRTRKDRKHGGFELTLDTGHTFNLLPAYASDVKAFLGLESLIYTPNISKTHKLLMKMGLRDLDKDIREMSTEEVIHHFSTASGSSVVMTDLILNFLWQQIVLIRAGHDSPADGGNLRTLWYEIQHVVKKLPNIGNSDPYKVVSEQLAIMVKSGICSYSEFKFYDDGRWNIGAYNPHVIFMAEKEAHIGMFLKKMQDLTGVTIIATGGQPSGVTSEYFCTEFKRVLKNFPDSPEPVVVALVDYDPFGWVLQKSFMRDLATFGVKVKKPVTFLVVPENFTQEELDDKYKDLVKEQKTPLSMLRRWMRITNGINGKPYGMEAGQFIKDRTRAKEIFLQTIAPLLVVPVPVPRQFWAEEETRRQNLFIEAFPVFNRCLMSIRKKIKP